jgi:SCP-2 sterol transfer family/Mycothiol maleylpyruvate isomerase N-terminal domain
MASPVISIDSFVAETAKQGKREANEFSQYLKNLPEKRWLNQSFCTDWTIKDVVEHQVAQGKVFLELVQGTLAGNEVVFNLQLLQQTMSSIENLNRTELAESLSNSTTEFYDLLENASAESLEKAVTMPFAKLKLANIASFRLSELSLHSWDVRVVENLTTKVSRDSIPLLYPGLVSFLPLLANRESLKELGNTTYQLEISGAVKKPIALTLKDGKLQVQEEYLDNPSAVIKLDADAFLRLAWGRLRMDWMVKDGWIKVEGDKDKALKLNNVFKGL